MDQPKPTEAELKQEILKQKKAAHDYIASLVQLATTRTKFKVLNFELESVQNEYYFDEIPGVLEAVQFGRNMRDQIRKDIELIEPPPPPEPAKPMEIDLTHLKAVPDVP